ncbi:MAG: PAS domain S-box protein, partial [Chloroflexi bacterium]|nr:PAS domain S-box protein [Chloroflexota bacterium]
MSQYVGGLYFILAVMSAVSEARTQHVPVAETIAAFFRQTRESYRRVAEDANVAVGAKQSGMTVAKWVGLAVPVLLLLLLLFSLAVDTGFVYYPLITLWGLNRSLFSLLNIVFVVLISLVVAYIAARSYIATGQPRLAWLGGGMLALGFSGLLAVALPTTANVNVPTALNNTGALLTSVLCLVGTLTFSGSRSPHPRPKAGRFLTGIYAAVVLLMVLIFILSLQGVMPAFWIPGVGGTFLRQVVINSAVVLLAISGASLMLFYYRNRVTFNYWYSLALILLALGYLTVGFANAPGDTFSWLGRVSQYVGGVYFIVAGLSVTREASTRGTSVAEVIAEFGKQARVNYELLVNAASDAIIAVDGLGRILTWNPAAAKMFGYSRNEAIGTAFFDLIASPEAVDAYHQAADNAIPEKQEQGAVTIETKARRKNGEEFPVELTLVSRRLVAGWLPTTTTTTTTTTTLVVRDISERKKAEELIRFQSLLVESAHDAIVATTITPRGEFITRTWNKGAEALYGWQAEEVVGKRTRDFLQPEFPQPGTIEDYGKRFFEQGFWAGEVTFARKDGSKVTVLTSHTALRDSTGRIVGAVGIHHDITELKKTEEQRQRLAREAADTLSELQTVLDTAPFAIWIARDPECRVITGNIYANEVLGVHRGDNISRSALPGEAAITYRVLRNGVEVKPEEMPAQVAAATGKMVTPQELEFVFADGRRLHMLIGAVPLLHADGQIRGAVAVGADISEQKQAMQMKDEFIGMVSHELRTPLTVFLG